MKAHGFQTGHHPFTNLTGLEAPKAHQEKTNVLLHRERRQKGWVLKNQTHILGMALIEAQVLLGLAKQRQCTRGGHLQTCQQAQHRRLTGSGRSHHRQPLARFHPQIDAIKHGTRSPLHGEITHLNDRR